VVVVLESMTLGTPRSKRQHRVKPIQCLNGSLFIHAEHRCMTRWVEIMPDDIGNFGFKVWIVAGHIAFEPVRLQSSLFPGPMYGVFAYSQGRSQLAATPVRRSTARLLTRCRRNLRPQARRQHAGRLTRMVGIQSIHPQTKEAGLPADDGRCRGSKLLLDHAESGAFGQHQNQPSPKHISGRQRTRLCNAAQFSALRSAILR
jgi:hypothetical protein